MTLPNIGDGAFDLILFKPGGEPFNTGLTLSAGDEFNFVEELTAFGVGPAGLGKFGIRGIETIANVDPNSGTAFVTDLTFVGDGRFTGTQKPIVAPISVRCPCSGPSGTTEPWKNHGKYVSCVAGAAKDFVRQVLITELKSRRRQGQKSTCSARVRSVRYAHLPTELSRDAYLSPAP